MQENTSRREHNKAQKKATLLGVAEKLFAEKGYDATSIDEVAQGANLTKRTLYQYYLSKEDLYYAVALRAAQDLYVAFLDAFARGENTREKIRLANMVHMAFYREHPDQFRILNYEPSNRKNVEASPNYQEIRRLDALRMGEIASMVSEGAKDGSIKGDLDTKKAVLFGFFSAFSMLYTFAQTGRSLWNALEIDEEEFLRFSFDLFVDALK